MVGVELEWRLPSDAKFYASESRTIIAPDFKKKGQHGKDSKRIVVSADIQQTSSFERLAKPKTVVSKGRKNQKNYEILDNPETKSPCYNYIGKCNSFGSASTYSTFLSTNPPSTAGFGSRRLRSSSFGDSTISGTIKRNRSFGSLEDSHIQSFDSSYDERVLRKLHAPSPIHERLASTETYSSARLKGPNEDVKKKLMRPPTSNPCFNRHAQGKFPESRPLSHSISRIPSSSRLSGRNDIAKKLKNPLASQLFCLKGPKKDKLPVPELKKVVSSTEVKGPVHERLASTETYSSAGLKALDELEKKIEKKKMLTESSLVFNRHTQGRFRTPDFKIPLRRSLPISKVQGKDLVQETKPSSSFQPMSGIKKFHVRNKKPILGKSFVHESKPTLSEHLPSSEIRRKKLHSRIKAHDQTRTAVYFPGRRRPTSRARQKERINLEPFTLPPISARSASRKERQFNSDEKGASSAPMQEHSYLSSLVPNNSTIEPDSKMKEHHNRSPSPCLRAMSFDSSIDSVSATNENDETNPHVVTPYLSQVNLLNDSKSLKRAPLKSSLTLVQQPSIENTEKNNDINNKIIHLTGENKIIPVEHDQMGASLRVQSFDSKIDSVSIINENDKICPLSLQNKYDNLKQELHKSSSLLPRTNTQSTNIDYNSKILQDSSTGRGNLVSVTPIKCTSLKPENKFFSNASSTESKTCEFNQTYCEPFIKESNTLSISNSSSNNNANNGQAPDKNEKMELIPNTVLQLRSKSSDSGLYTDDTSDENLNYFLEKDTAIARSPSTDETSMPDYDEQSVCTSKHENGDKILPRSVFLSVSNIDTDDQQCISGNAFPSRFSKNPQSERKESGKQNVITFQSGEVSQQHRLNAQDTFSSARLKSNQKNRRQPILKDSRGTKTEGVVKVDDSNIFDRLASTETVNLKLQKEPTRYSNGHDTFGASGQNTLLRDFKGWTYTAGPK